MAATSLAYRDEASTAAIRPREPRPREHKPRENRPREPLAGLADLGSTDIETSLVANLSDDLHSLFDPISEGALPIYFGPLLGRLYLEGL